MVRRNAAREKHTALWTALAALALGACATIVRPLLADAADTICPPPADLPSAPWTAALLFAGVAGAALVLVKRGGGGPKNGTPARRRWRRGAGGGLAAVIAMSLISGAATSRSVPGTAVPVTASADTCPPSPSPSPSATPQGATPSPAASPGAGAGSSGSGHATGVSGATVPVPATGARGMRDGIGR